MAEIRPFRGIYYQKPPVKDLSAVICPPYDVISPEQQQALLRRSDFNFVRVEYQPGSPQDGPQDNRYTRAAAALEGWLADGVLGRAGAPAVYLHDHHFLYQGAAYCRRVIICLVKLEDWSAMVVRPHEGTLSRPKGDRLNLLRALRANTSPILSLYDGSGIAALLEERSRREPLLEAEADGERHRLWALDDVEAIRAVTGALAGQPVYIADGHHRYESALNYMKERRAASPAGEAPSDFVMMALEDFADPGMVVMPAHRLVRGLSGETVAGLPVRLAEFFDIEKLPLDAAEARAQVAGLPEDVSLVGYGSDPGNLLLLRLRRPDDVASMMPPGRTGLYRSLDVSIIDHVIVEHLLGMNADTAGGSLAYNHDAADTVRRVRDGEYQLAFIVRPVRAEVIKAIADSRDRMPRKSTYFYPKAPAGLVFYRFD